MHAPRCTFRLCALALVALQTACLPQRRTVAPTPLLARRLVLALDGIDYRDIAAAKARGLFPAFRTPSRLISTFPSISDISWHEIFRVLPPRGYQRIYYSTGYNSMIGAPLDAIRPIEFEQRMDMAFGAKFHHLGAYVMSNTIARREVDTAVRDFFTIGGRSTVYVYNVGPDALQHTRGDLDRYLLHLDTKLAALMVEYQQRTGRALEVVLLSDHGHNRAVDARFLPLVKTLEARGFRISDRLRTPSDVAFSVDGVTTGFGVFANADSIASLAQLLASEAGVELVTTRVSDSVFTVQNATLRARIERRQNALGDRYRYVPSGGDPLHYMATLARMRGDSALDRDGFADAATWVRYSAAETYPAAVVRIVRGHTAVTLNPAPILVSVADAFRMGLGMVSMANRMRPLGGTHGSLSATSSLGVLMTNFQDTHDDVTFSVHEQFDGFADLGALSHPTPGGRLTSTWLIGRDSRTPFAMGRAMSDAPALEIWLTDKQLAWANGSGHVLMEVRRTRGDDRPTRVVGTSYLPLPTAPGTEASGWIASTDRRRYVFPLPLVITAALEPNTAYTIRVVLDRVGATSGPAITVDSQRITELFVRTNAAGQLPAY